jgi:hydrogenase expression/formation protein HypC
MCIGIPMRVLSAGEGCALCERRGERSTLNMLLIGDVAPGDYVLAFQGSAVRVLTPEEAAQTDAALDALQAALDGADDITRHFADLVGREPELPAHLRGETR